MLHFIVPPAIHGAVVNTPVLEVTEQRRNLWRSGSPQKIFTRDNGHSLASPRLLSLPFLIPFFLYTIIPPSTHQHLSLCICYLSHFSFVFCFLAYLLSICMHYLYVIIHDLVVVHTYYSYIPLLLNVKYIYLFLRSVVHRHANVSLEAG